LGLFDFEKKPEVEKSCDTAPLKKVLQCQREKTMFFDMMQVD
jgi:hypothetical protein